MPWLRAIQPECSENSPGKTDMRVPFLDLKAHHDPLKQEFAAAIQEVIDSSAFAGGPFVARFE